MSRRVSTDDSCSRRNCIRLRQHLLPPAPLAPGPTQGQERGQQNANPKAPALPNHTQVSGQPRLLCPVSPGSWVRENPWKSRRKEPDPAMETWQVEAGTVAHRPQITSCTPALTSAPRPQSLPAPRRLPGPEGETGSGQPGEPRSPPLGNLLPEPFCSLAHCPHPAPCTTSRTTRPPGLQVPRTPRFLLHASGGNKRQETLPRTWVPLLQDDLCPFRV
ncbi:PREDICTED: E3 ubiquitin-protein ligase synoviolin-like [Bison bison bison]|uniref:E3 ubiquitin-protein ligase synoviolin-like n=1 Tax=Bison bison bison TaxID=43346 RepID=A0A6P3IXM9_BISBB|nr:PREDICTED: E3 ubiquitin-protein ligase synoviolin-like [Bison bison bison]